MPNYTLPFPYWVREYTLVVRSQAAPHYVSPYDPACQASQRYLAVHATDGEWGVVDRRTGKLLGRATPGRSVYRYLYRAEAERVVAGFNNGEQPASVQQRKRA